MIIDVNAINKIDMTDFPFSSNPERYLFLAKKDKTDFVYNTAALEGNAMTYPEVETLLDGITVGGHKLSDEQQVLNQARSLDLLFELIAENKFMLNKTILCSLHAQVAKDEALQWGLFRDGNVNIGGTEYMPPQATHLDDLFRMGVAEVLEIKHPVLQGISYFLFGARSQFFYDGNKRTSRLMMNGVLLSSGFPMLNIKAKDKLAFNTMMLNFYDSGDYLIAVTFLLDYYLSQNIHLK